MSGALLASRAGCKIVPVAHNAGYFWPRRGWVKKPGVIRVVIGPPIEAAGRDPRELNEEVRAWIEATLASMSAAPVAEVEHTPVRTAYSVINKLLIECPADIRLNAVN